MSTLSTGFRERRKSEVTITCRLMLSTDDWYGYKYSAQKAVQHYEHMFWLGLVAPSTVDLLSVSNLSSTRVLALMKICSLTTAMSI